MVQRVPSQQPERDPLRARRGGGDTQGHRVVGQVQRRMARRIPVAEDLRHDGQGGLGYDMRGNFHACQTDGTYDPDIWENIHLYVFYNNTLLRMLLYYEMLLYSVYNAHVILL